MTFASLLGLLAMIAAAGQPMTGSPPAQLTFNIYIRGDLAGTERVEETVLKDGSTVTSSWHEMLVTDRLETKRLAYESTLTMAKGTYSPVRYSVRYTSGNSLDACEVSLRSGQLVRVLTRGGKTMESSIPADPSIILLDFNVYHHYDYVVRRYDAKQGGRQVFKDYIPVLGNTIGLAVTPLEDSELDFGRGRMKVKNYKLEFVGIRTGVLSVDSGGRLVRLVIRDQDLEVLRSDVVPGTPPADAKP